VECRGYSEGLQRAMTDFGADEAFAGAATKLQEHYGIEVPVSAVRGFTEAHGAAMRVQEKLKSDWPDRAGVPVLISEMDGSMLPVVETAAFQCSPTRFPVFPAPRQKRDRPVPR